MKSNAPTTKDGIYMIALLVFFLMAEPVIDWVLSLIFF